jgi:cytoskeletal protein CcmA (bactofilin family)
MALFGKERERNERPRGLNPESPAPTPAPVPREVEMSERDRDGGKPDETSVTSAFLGKGSRVTGKVTFEGPARIEGHVEGEVSAQDALVIGEGAVVNAQIVGSSVVIHGKVTGDVTARKKLEIRAPGKLYGNITTPSLVIHEGVTFEGQCTMGGTESPRAEKDRKVAFFPKEERPAEPMPLKAHSELAK